MSAISFLFRYENYLHLQFLTADFRCRSYFEPENELGQIRISNQAFKATAFFTDCAEQAMRIWQGNYLNNIKKQEITPAFPH